VIGETKDRSAVSYLGSVMSCEWMRRCREGMPANECDVLLYVVLYMLCDRVKISFFVLSSLTILYVIDD
jgi:hypothetical protein